jgi:hypothetical protein
MTTNLPISKEEISSILTTCFEPKTFCYQEFINRNKRFIRNEFFDDLEMIDELHFFNKEITDKKIKGYILNNYFTDDEVTDEQYSDISTGISETLKIRSEIFNANLLNALNSQELEANSYSELQEMRLDILNKHVDLLLTNRGVLGEHIGSYYDALIVLKKIYPNSIADKFMKCEIREGKTYAQFLHEYPIALASIGKIEQSNNKKLHEVVQKLSDRVIHMNSSGYSLNGIQKVLTEECIEYGIIPPTVSGLSRDRGAKGVPVSKPTLLPLSAIRKVIADNAKLLLT